jgi:hypothetical protein
MDKLNHKFSEESQKNESNTGTFSGRVYAFLYNDCIHESTWRTISTHYSKEGAEKAMQEHKQEQLDEFNEMYQDDNEWGFKFGIDEDWCIETIEVLP